MANPTLPTSTQRPTLTGPVLVTGSSGRIGAAIAQRLSTRGVVHGIDRRVGLHTTMVADLRDADALRAVMRGCVAVVHTASLHAPHVGQVSAAEFHSINVAGTERLLAIAAELGITRVVYTSTTSVYGAAMVDEDRAVWVDESLAPIPRDIYDETKLAAERLCAAWAAAPGRTSVVLRMSRCFPEHDPTLLLYRLYRGVDARDVAEAHALALAVQTPGFLCCNVSAQTPFRRDDVHTLKQDAARVLAQRCPEVVAYLRRRRWAVPSSIDRVYAIDGARRALGYTPVYNYPELLRQLAADDPSHP